MAKRWQDIRRKHSPEVEAKIQQRVAVRMDEGSWRIGYNAGYASPKTPPEVPTGVTDTLAFSAGVIEGQADKQAGKQPFSSS
jgi:hypothetical protein